MLRGRRPRAVDSRSRRRRRYLAGALAGAFVVLTVGVARRTFVATVDDRVWRLSVDLRYDPLVDVARAVTAVISPPLCVGALIVVASLVSVRRASARPLLWAALPVAVVMAVVVGLKRIVGRPGPGSLDLHKANGAYPSGHTASLLVCGAAIILLLGLRAVRAAWLTLGALLTLVLCSLWYAHQHWLSDMVGSGLFAGALVLLLYDRLSCEPHPGGPAEPELQPSPAGTAAD